MFLDHAHDEARVALVASGLLPSLEGVGGFLWSPEFGDHMIEGIPGAPFSSDLSALLQVEQSLRQRCEVVEFSRGQIRFYYFFLGVSV